MEKQPLLERTHVVPAPRKDPGEVVARLALMGGGGRNNVAHPSFESLDAFFCDCLERVESAYPTLDKAYKIRVECWIVKLNGPYPLPNVAWRKNRNAFAALLARAVEMVDFREPFDKRPPEGSLPTLAPHLRSRIPDQNPCRRSGRDFWEQQRAWLDRNRNRSGRNFTQETAEASRTFQPRRVPPPASRRDSPRSHQSTAPPEVGGRDRVNCSGSSCGIADTPPPPFSSGDASSSPTAGNDDKHRDCRNNDQPPPCACAAARAAYHTALTSNNVRCCACSPWLKNNAVARKGGSGGDLPLVRGCEGQCGCDASEKLRALQTTFREQALQLAALRIQQAYRGEAQTAELQRIRREHIRETEGIARLQQNDEARCRLTSVRLEGMLAEREGEEEEQQRQHPMRNQQQQQQQPRRQHAQHEEEQEEGERPSRPKLQQLPPRASLEVVDGTSHRMNNDLERRLDSFQEDARVLVDVAKQRKIRAGTTTEGFKTFVNRPAA